MKRLLAICVATATLAASCAQQTGAGSAGKDNVAVVDGQPISRSMFDEYVAAVSSSSTAPITAPQREVLLENLIRAQVIVADAETSGVADSEQTRAKIALARLNVVAEAATTKFREQKPTDSELRAEYASKVSAMAPLEYRASHILVPTEAVANQVLVQLKAGAKFGELARRFSTDAGTKDKGGDLDWFSPTAMTPPFADALTKLRKGETTAAPVQTEFGWHLIWLMDTRAASPPPFENVKDALAEMVENAKFKTHVEGLIAKAKITKSL